MKNFIFAAVILGAFCAMQVSASLSCYDCNDCATVTGSTNTCNGTVCLIESTKVNTTTTVNRSCGNAADCTGYKESGCTTEGDQTTCCCKTAKCNGVAAMTSAALVVMASVVTGIILARF